MMKTVLTGIASLGSGAAIGWVNILVLRHSVGIGLMNGKGGAWCSAKLVAGSVLRMACIAFSGWLALKIAGVFAAITLLIGVAFSTMVCSRSAFTRGIR